MCRYVVVIVFREPTYELHAELGALPRLALVETLASDAAEAIRLALDEFRRAEIASSVGWIREVVSTEVACMEDCA